MAEKLKDFFDEGIVRGIARDLRRDHRALDEESFVAECLGSFADLTLTQRGRHVAEVMRRHLPDDYEVAAGILERSLGPELERSDTFGLAPLRYMPHVMFVARFGLEQIP